MPHATIYVYTDLHTYMHAYIYMCIEAYICVYMCVDTYIYIYGDTYVCTLVHTCTHTVTPVTDLSVRPYKIDLKLGEPYGQIQLAISTPGGSTVSNHCKLWDSAPFAWTVTMNSDFK